MTEVSRILLTILAFALVIGPLVFVHELGHYLVGRLFGVKADEFSIGFGRAIAGFTDKRGTLWKFGWLPLGGYVKFAGDMDPSSRASPEWLSLPAEERARTFQSKAVWKRALIVAAGPFTNFLVAIVIYASFAVLVGVDRTPSTVGRVTPNSAAAAVGLQAGDRITALGGRSVESFEDLIYYTVLRPQQPVGIDFIRAGQAMHRDAVIGVRTETDARGNVTRLGILGIGPPSPVFSRASPLEAPLVGIRKTFETIRATLDGLGQILGGQRSVKDLGGPIKMADASGQVFSLGLDAIIAWVAFISINLGFINLLPVPVLDGGHLLFYGIEAIRRRPIEPQVVEWAFRGGLMAILALMLLVTFNDLDAFGVWKNLAGLIG